ncbi:MAG: alanine/glycine:cation symporter family protein [Fusicatenibacter sp.]|nr:sodium:alanine symporter family protein [Fusicatenibacter sp.]
MLADWIKYLDDVVWGPPMIVLLIGTGMFLTLHFRGLPIRNLGYALGLALGKDARKNSEDEGGVSPFSSLMTELAASIGTGNIIGVASAVNLGGPGALFWMMLSALTGFSLKFSESFLSVKYRVKGKSGQYCGGPMYTLAQAFPDRRLGRILGKLYALFAVMASFGMGNMTQSNSISLAVEETFHISRGLSGLFVAILTILVILGGIGTIAAFTRYLVPVMAIFYMAGALWVIGVNCGNLPTGIASVIESAFSLKAVGGGAVGICSASVFRSMRYGVSRGIFSNEAGLGAGGITAAAAQTDDPVRQGYISMTGVFLDTMVICLVTGLVLVTADLPYAPGIETEACAGTTLVIAAFSTVFGKTGGYLVSIGITLFAFATIIGWEYQGEKAFEFVTGRRHCEVVYRFAYGLAAFAGAICTMETVWCFSDLANALMAVPNLICVIVLSKTIRQEILSYEKLRKRKTPPFCSR